MTEASAVSMFAALLDRSFVQIGESVADARYFDREKVVRIADIWDNNTFPLFGVALCRPGWMRERRARAALRWMAGPGPTRRAWMIEQAAAAGYRLEPALGPQGPLPVHSRDSLGLVCPGVVPLTAAVAAGVGQDYDLAGAEVRTVRVERAGQRLSGHLSLTAPRRYTRPPDRTDAVVQLLLDDVQAVHFDSNDGIGATLTSHATGVEVHLGAGGRLRAAAAAVTVHDTSWRLSRCGRAADADTPPRNSTRRSRPGRTPPQPRGAASDAAFVLREAMLEIRSIRYPRLAGKTSLREISHAFAGAGARMLNAAAQPPSARDRAFRRLAEEWIGASLPLARQIARMLPEGHRLHQMSPTGPPQPTAGMPTRAQLALASYTAGHNSHGTRHDATAVVNLAVPEDDGSWMLRTLNFPRVDHLMLDATAFTALHTVSGSAGLSLTRDSDTLTVTCREPHQDHHDLQAP